MKELFQIQPDPEPFDFEEAEMCMTMHEFLAESHAGQLYADTARLLRDAIERLR